MNAQLQVDVKQHKRFNLNHLSVLAKRKLDATQLTPMYSACKIQLAQLVKIDEVKEIADKHSAIAHYAKQIKDQSLRYYAERVYARALARIGELLKELEPQDRKQAAENNGLSQSETTNAVNIARLPRRALDALIDRDPPASKGELVGKGMRLAPTRPQRVADTGTGYGRHVQYHEPFGKAKCVVQDLIDTLKPCEHYESSYADRGDGKPDPAEIVRALQPDEAAIIRAMLAPIIEWCDELDQLLEKRTAEK